MLTPSEILEYYSREDVQDALLQLGRGREVVGVFRNGGFGSRPNVILYRQDIVSMARSGVAEFHSSLERWSNPMMLRPDNYDALRQGWDLVLDLDGRDFGHVKLAARILYTTLEKHGLSAISVKYTGGKGFHLGIPWESMPPELNFSKTSLLFPGLARQIGLYLRERMRDEFERGLLKMNSPEELAEMSGKPLERIMAGDDPSGEHAIDPFQVVDIDPVLISPRHLFRMPYSLNRGTGYASLPISINDIGEFEKSHAAPRGLRVRRMFLNPGEPGEASGLVAEAADWWSIWNKKAERKSRVIERPGEKIPERLFPPCIKNISLGIPDGRKRAVHILLNFLRSCGWSWQDTESFIDSWNLKNRPPLSESYIRGQVRWQKMRKKTVPPPNCTNPGYYESFGVCTPDETCGGQARTVKNPAVYPLRKMMDEKPGIKNKRITGKSKAPGKRGPPEPPAASEP